MTQTKKMVPLTDDPDIVVLEGKRTTTSDGASREDWGSVRLDGGGAHAAGAAGALEAAVLACEAAFSRYSSVRWSQSSSDVFAEALRQLVNRHPDSLAPWRPRVDALWERVQARRRGGGDARATGGERTAFERDQSNAARQKISVRRALGSQGDRKAAA